MHFCIFCGSICAPALSFSHVNCPFPKENSRSNDLRLTRSSPTFDPNRHCLKWQKPYLFLVYHTTTLLCKTVGTVRYHIGSIRCDYGYSQYAVGGTRGDACCLLFGGKPIWQLRIRLRCHRIFYSKQKSMARPRYLQGNCEKIQSIYLAISSKV